MAVLVTIQRNDRSECLDPGQFQERLHTASRVERACFDGAGWDPDDLGNLVYRFLVIVDEIEHFPVGSRKLLQHF
jgi:hypothetical protein